VVFRLVFIVWPPQAEADSGFKGEIVAGLYALFDLPQKETAGSQQLTLRRERRETGGDQVGVDELGAARHLGQVFQREGGFARAVGSGDYPAGGFGFIVPLLAHAALTDTFSPPPLFGIFIKYSFPLYPAPAADNMVACIGGIYSDFVRHRHLMLCFQSHRFAVYDASKKSESICFTSY